MLVALALVLIAFGAVVLLLAPAIQRVGVAECGQPRNRIAALSVKLAASPVALRSIRMTGAMCLGIGVALLALLLVRSCAS